MNRSTALKTVLVSTLLSFIIVGCTVEKSPDVVTTPSPPSTTIVHTPTTPAPAPNVTVTPPASSSSTHTETHTVTPTPGGGASSTTTTTGG